MGQIEIDVIGADTFVKVKMPTGGIWAQTHVDHDSFGKLVMKWFREAPKDVTGTFLAGLWFEHELAVTLSTKTEEERLQELNVSSDEVSFRILHAVCEVAEAAPFSVNDNPFRAHVDIGKVGSYLRDTHFDVPPGTVYMFLKGVEAVDGRCRDIDEGFFSIDVSMLREWKEKGGLR